MAKSTGSIFTLDDTKKQLTELNRNTNNQQTWKNMLGNINLNSALSQQGLTQSFNGAVNEAYNSYLANQTDIANSGIVGGGRNALFNESQASMSQAYNTYLQNLAKGQTSIEENRVAAQTEIDDALTKQAQNTIDYADSYYNYLNELAYKYNKDAENYVGEDSYSGLFDNPNWAKYTVTDENGNAVRDENGKIQLRDYNDIYSNFYSYDEDGNRIMTTAGLDFFDQLSNENIGDYSFEQFLKENNNDLYSWAIGYNEYSNEGNNATTMKNLLGQNPDDNTYSFLERAGGLNEGQLKNIFTQYNTLIEELATIDYTDPKNKATVLDSLTNANDNIYGLAEQLGMTDQLEAAGINKDSLSLLQQKISDITSLGKNALDEKELAKALDDAGITLEDTNRNALIAGATGTVVTGVGLAFLSTGVGAILSLTLLGGGIIASLTASASENENNKRKDKATEQYRQKLIAQYEDTYNNSVNTLMNSALSSKRQSEIDAGMMPSTPSTYTQNSTLTKEKAWKNLANKTTISTVKDWEYNNYSKGKIITDNQGNEWEVTEVIDNDYAKKQGFSNGDRMFESIIGSTDWNGSDGKIVKGALQDTYYIPLSGFGTWAMVKPKTKK